MSEFTNALISEKRNPLIPEEYDWYAPLIGDWNFDYFEPNGRHVEGEWLFRRVLDGLAIEDLFICPSRATREANPQPDAEYGAAIRMFNVEKKCYDMTYVCNSHTTRLEIHKEKKNIICTVIDDSTRKWVFSDITSDSFHWKNCTVLPNGEWDLNCELIARRK